MIEWHDSIRPERVEPYQIPASNILDDVRRFSPPQFYIYDVTRLTAQGFSAGSVAVYIANTGEQIASFTQAGTLYFNPGGDPFITGQQDRLVFTATGLTGIASVSMGYIKVPYDAIGQYLLS